MAVRSFFGRWWFNATSGVRDFTEGNALTRKRVLDKVDKASFQKKVVAVAGVGFGTDAYDIFALNAIIPILGYVYWPNGSIPPSFLTALYCSTLVGSVIGQLVFGLLGDILGRRRMYGVVLLIQTIGTVGVAMASRGEYGSMSFEGWLIFWRVWMGIGIGGDYPLSAVICSEFAPRRHRRRMLASVFFSQPLGQLLGTLVGMVVIASVKDKLPNRTANYLDIASDPFLNSTCIDTITRMPTVDISILQAQNPLCGVSCGVGEGPSSHCFKALDSAWRWVIGFGAVPVVVGIISRWKVPGTPRWLMDVAGGGRHVESTLNRFFEGDDLSISEHERQPAMHPHTNGDARPPPHDSPRHSSDADSSTDHHHHHHPTAHDDLSLDDTPPPAESIREYICDWRQTFLRDGAWRYLLGTSLAWLFLDIPFYGFQLSYSQIIGYIWYGDGYSRNQTSVYDYLWTNLVHQLVVVSIGALLGGALMIALIPHVAPRRIQLAGFATLAVLLLVTGTAFTHLGKGVIVMYVLCQLSFNLGPNVTTYAIPAELFPTRFRCFSHGISAAAGKIGSIIAQLVFAYARFDGRRLYDAGGERASEWLGKAFLVFFAFAVAGAIVTFLLVPDTTDARGESLALELLAKGPDAVREKQKRRSKLFKRAV